MRRLDRRPDQSAAAKEVDLTDDELPILDTTLAAYLLEPIRFEHAVAGYLARIQSQQ